MSKINKPDDPIALFRQAISDPNLTPQEKIDRVVEIRDNIDDTILLCLLDQYTTPHVEHIDPNNHYRPRAEMRLSNLKRLETSRQSCVRIQYQNEAWRHHISEKELTDMVIAHINRQAHENSCRLRVFTGQNGSYIGEMTTNPDGTIDYSNQIGFRTTYFLHTQINDDDVSIEIRLFEPIHNPPIPYLEIEVRESVDFEDVISDDEFDDDEWMDYFLQQQENQEG